MRIPSRASLILLLAAWAPTASGADDPAWPVTHHELTVRIDPATSAIEVTGGFDVERRGPADAPLHFVLNGALDLERATIGGEPVDVRSRDRWRPRDFYRRPDYGALAGFARVRQHSIPAPAGGWPEGPIRVEVEYAGAIYDSLRAPDVAYARGFETTTGLIDPRGAFLTSETFWVPWSSDERFSFRLRTELRDGWHSMSQGTRVEHVDGDVNVSVWEETHPQELVYLVAGPYTIRERMHGDVALYTYTYANTDEELANTYLDGAGRYLDLYGEMFGPYPFGKWAMVENWWQTGFGMPSFTLLGDRVIRLPFIVHTSYGHEILHCWWGNGVYVDYEHGNWCEGLTAYGADYLYKTWESEAAARDHRRNQLVGYLDFASRSDRDFALRDFRERSDFGTQAIGYGKTMMVFHMLEREVGDEAFGEALRHFYSTHTFEPAAWSDIESSFEEITERDLSVWFEQWVERTGAPELRLGATEQLKDGRWSVAIEQEEPVYALNVPVRVETASGGRTMNVGLPSARHLLVLPADATAVSIDPDWHLFRKLYREEIPPTLSQGLGAERTLVVIGADAPRDVAAALRTMAVDWAKNQDMEIVDEADVEDGEARSLFLLGDGPLARRALDAGAAFGDEPRERVAAAGIGEDSFVYVVRDPTDAERAWTVVLPEDAAACAALGRKLPHYSKYSWLRFDGEENVGKGNWTVVDSPLRRELAKGAGR